MGSISVLDCTLRDGGYCNKWLFGLNNIKKIIRSLVEADIDIIECGFLTNTVDYNTNATKFTELSQISKVIPANRNNKMYVCMINYGEYNADDIPPYDGTSVDGLRIAFHKNNMVEAIEFCKCLKEKGYKIFVQPMVSLSYSDEQFLELIECVNQLNPYSFYIVDSFGVMKRNDLIRLFYIVEHNLKKSISIGYHSHNNMQLAYSNAQVLVDIHTNRKIIFDSSVFGMGRGAGNLNTELFVEYLNDSVGKTYVLKPILKIIDEIINGFYQKNYWGYSLTNYLSAKYNSHPNYARYLDTKKTLTIENMNEIFSIMDDSKRFEYDKDYIESLYQHYMANDQVQEMHLNEFTDAIKDKDILIIAPGLSSIEEKNSIIEYAKKNDIVSISINFDYSEISTDYIFVSNLRRFGELDESKHDKCIVTSNIHESDVYLKIKYSDLLNNVESVRDNAGMMLIKLMINLGAGKVSLAGLDGYSVDPTQNFADDNMNFYARKAEFESMNAGMIEVLKEFKNELPINFVTKPRHVLI